MLSLNAIYSFTPALSFLSSVLPHSTDAFRRQFPRRSCSVVLVNVASGFEADLVFLPSPQRKLFLPQMLFQCQSLVSFSNPAFLVFLQ